MSQDANAKSRAAKIGQGGEQLVAEWLHQQGWKILAQHWISRWGELDIVALRPKTTAHGSACIAFVEVKTRSSGSWDEQGLTAITPTKQKKLWKTAQLFLSAHPHLAELPCRFDIALVAAQPTSRQPHPSTQSLKIQMGQPITLSGQPLVLHTYLTDAFSLEY